ncbi:MAG: glycosyltransferase family 39 protein [Anaerolineales bacterium]|nr:glycosyltransferase family 39 protein [Anaerolineales bacterium]
MSAVNTRRLVLVAIAASFAAQMLAWIDALPLVLRVALLLVLSFAPGMLVVEWLLGDHYGDDDASRVEKMLYGLGIGYLLLITTALAVSYLPGGVAAWQILLPVDVVLFVAAGTLWRRARRQRALQPASQSDDQANRSASWPDRRTFGVGVVLVLVAGALLRAPNLDYSEFQGDEARVMLRASEVIEGYENALFAHQKMPGEILVETATYAVTRRMNEAAARLPFTVAGLAALVGVLLLGARLFGAVAGVSAGLLAALTGYFVAFARIVQYQSLVLLAVVLTILVLWRMLDAQRALGRYLAVAALLMALGVLAHYEAIGILAPVLFILWRLWRSGVKLTIIARALPLPLLLFAGPVLLFAIPFTQDPTFAAAYAYAVGYRVDAGGFPYNNLVDFFQRASLYNIAYYILWMTALAFIALVGVYRRNLPVWLAWTLTLLAGGGLAFTFVQPSWLLIGGVDHTWLFFALVMSTPLFAPKVSPAERLLWWWFGSLAMFSLFVVQRPNSHVYTFFIPWVLLGGMVLERAAGWAAQRFSPRAARGAGLLVGGTLMLLFGFYLHRLFVYTGVEVLRLWPEQRPIGYWMPFDNPPEVAIFGFPHTSGWKAIGVQYADGELEGNFLTNEKPEVVDWYTRGAGVCPRGDNLYIVASRTEPQADLAARELVDKVANEFALRQVVEVMNEPKLHLFDQPGEYEVERFDLAQFIRRFDQELTGPALINRRGRVVAPAIQHRLGYRLGDEIELLGYDLDRIAAAPGDVVALTLYWRALRPMQNAYTVFNQIIDLATTAKAGQVDGMPVCDRNPTGQWFAGDVIADPYTIPIAPDAAPGTYTLISGMYNPATGARLEMQTADGATIGTEATLMTIEIR